MGVIVAIGGGENGHTKKDGTITSYETGPIDSEIVNLTVKSKPNFLFLAHASGEDINTQDGYYNVMSNIYHNRFNCECRNLYIQDLSNLEYCKELIDWADIIYEGGGNTEEMLNVWRTTGFDKLLKYAYDKDKVLCGVSAGGMCWFKTCLTNKKIEFKKISGLGFFEGMYVPHADLEGRKEECKKNIKGTNEVGIMVSNCAAIEIVDNNFKILYGQPADKDFVPFVKKVYYDKDNYIETIIDNKNEYESLDNMTKKSNSKII